MVELVRSEIAHVGAEPFAVTKERFEVVAYANTLGISR
jgi:hypothetical protein